MGLGRVGAMSSPEPTSTAAAARGERLGVVIPLLNEGEVNALLDRDANV